MQRFAEQRQDEKKSVMEEHDWRSTNKKHEMIIDGHLKGSTTIFGHEEMGFSFNKRFFV